MSVMSYALFGQLPVLVTPLLRHSVLLLLAVGHWSPRLEFAADHHASEAVFEEIAFGLEETERVAELVWKDDFKRSFWDAAIC